DLEEIIKSVNKDLSTTVLFTNGWHLAERVEQLKKSGLDSVYVSIDEAEPERHNTFRKKEGLFARAMEGIKKAREAGLSTGISCCMTPEAFKDGEFEKIIELGRDIKIHEVLFFAAVPTGRYGQRKDLIGNFGWIEEMIASVDCYNKDSRYPGVLIYPYLSSHKSIGCSGGTCYVYISPYGDVCPCDFNHVIFGNVLEEPLYKIWDKMSSLDDFKAVKWGGCKLRDPDWQDKKTVSRQFCRYNF
ncbi:MAG: radical SAM protein, partial [bacterium]